MLCVCVTYQKSFVRIQFLLNTFAAKCLPDCLTDWMAKAHHIAQRCQNVYTNTQIYYITYSINTKLFKLSPLSLCVTLFFLSHAECVLARSGCKLSRYLSLALYSFTVVLYVLQFYCSIVTHVFVYIFVCFVCLL